MGSEVKDLDIIEEIDRREGKMEEFANVLYHEPGEEKLL